MCRVARLCSPEGLPFCPLLGPAHITHPKLGTQEGVRALGDLWAPIKPSQSSHKEPVIFDDLKGLVPERECEGEGGGETLKKTKRTSDQMPKEMEVGGGVCALSVILWALTPFSGISADPAGRHGKDRCREGAAREWGPQRPPTTLLSL